jgi:outer membrane immunogenic protein
MKKQILAALAVVALAGGTATAADLYTKAPRVVGPAFNCAAHQFGGVHLGVHGGSVYHQAHRGDTDGLLTDNAGWTLNKWGGHAGGQAGYSWTTCSTVWGVEIDGSWVFGTRNFLPDNPNGGGTGGITTRMDSLVTARLRSGVALDSLLLYATGGFAAASIRTNWADTAVSGVEFREWRWGWAAGFGTEWAWSRNISLKFETLYVGFTDRDQTGTVGGGTFNFRHSDSVWVSRVGLNYRFGGPVVARY